MDDPDAEGYALVWTSDMVGARETAHENDVPVSKMTSEKVSVRR